MIQFYEILTTVKSIESENTFVVAVDSGERIMRNNFLRSMGYPIVVRKIVWSYIEMVVVQHCDCATSH